MGLLNSSVTVRGPVLDRIWCRDGTENHSAAGESRSRDREVVPASNPVQTFRSWREWTAPLRVFVELAACRLPVRGSVTAGVGLGVGRLGVRDPAVSEELQRRVTRGRD